MSAPGGNFTEATERSWRQVPVCEQQSLSDRRSESFSRVARFELMSDGKDQHDVFGG